MAIVRFFNYFPGFFRLEAQNLYKYFACLFVCLFESNKHKNAELIEPTGRFMDAQNL